jgi:hypothetical protein
MTAVPKMGGVDGALTCAECSAPRWETHELCPDCWGKRNDGGTRNRQGVVIQARLPKKVWMATNFASQMLRDGTWRTVAIRRAASYYGVAYEDVQSAMSQRSGRSRTGKKRSA